MRSLHVLMTSCLSTLGVLQVDRKVTQPIPDIRCVSTKIIKILLSVGKFPPHFVSSLNTDGLSCTIPGSLSICSAKENRELYSKHILAS